MAEKAAAEKKREEEEAAERRRREEVLDSIRATVAVVAESDPLRLLQDTTATRERYGRNPDSKLVVMHDVVVTVLGVIIFANFSL